MQSTTTLLGLANNVLLSLNERPLRNLSGLAGQQLKIIIEQSLLRVSQLNDWDFLRSTRNAASWQASRAVLDGDVMLVKRVWFQNGTTTQSRVIVPFLDKDEFYSTSYGQSYNSANLGTMPTKCTVEDWNVIALNPYPTDVQSQQTIWFDVVRYVELPASENETFQMPQFFIPLLTRRCCAEYALRHLEDAQLAGQFNQEFEVEGQALRDRHNSGQNAQLFTMLRRRRRY